MGHQRPGTGPEGYDAEGTLDARLVPVTNTPATGTITLHATF